MTKLLILSEEKFRKQTPFKYSKKMQGFCKISTKSRLKISTNTLSID